MKPRILDLTPLALLLATLLSLTSCSSTSPPPPAAGMARLTYPKGVPGGVVIQTFNMTATVTAIDPANRQATLLASSAKTFIVKVGPEVAHFDRVSVGDQVNATVTETIVAHLDTQGAKASEGTGTVVAENTIVTAKIIAIDSVKHTATLRFEDDTTQTLPIRDDVDLSRRKVGEQVVFRVTEIIATRFEKMQ